MAVAAASRPPLRAQSYQVDDNKGRKAHLFRPPLTPATSSSADVNRQQQNSSRKRSRPTSRAHSPDLKPNSTRGYFDTPVSASHAGSWSQITPNASFESPALRSAASPPPFVDTRYNLASGLDTPIAMMSSKGAAEAESDFGMGSEEAYRRRWSADNESDRTCLRNKRLRPTDPNGGPAQSAGWSGFVFNIIGGVAGRMIEFCRSSTSFRGFYAGGGAAYPLSAPNDPNQNMQQIQREDTSSSLQITTAFEVISTPVPGHFPDSPPEDRAAKRKRENGGGWVMVPTPQPQDSVVTADALRFRASSSRIEPKRTPSASQIPRPLSRSGSRRSIAPTMVARRHSSTATNAGSPTQHNTQHRIASTASHRSPSSMHMSPPLQPQLHKRHSSTEYVAGIRSEHVSQDLSPDAQRYRARLRRQERDNDASMRKMNARLQDMIREGKAALGTKFDIEMDGLGFD